MQKFLVIQTAFIGDVVLATGIIVKLHAYFPEAQIDFLVRKGNESLLQNHPYLHEVLVWDKQKNKIGNLYRMLTRIRNAKYDKVINIQRFAATGMLTALSGAAETIGYDKNPWSRFFTRSIPHFISTAANPKHEIERCNELIEHFTDKTIFRPKLYPSTDDFEKVKAYKNCEYITVAPASVWFTKQFPKEKWISFINRLPEHVKVYLLGAPSDKQLCDDIIAGANLHNAVFNLSGKLNFLQSAALMRDAVMNFVNDSAPMHFASSVNAPVTAVYCSTIPSFGFGPLSDVKHIIEVQENLPCRPCGLHGHKACPQKHFKCAMDISNRQLLAVLQ